MKSKILPLLTRRPSVFLFRLSVLGAVLFVVAGGIILYASDGMTVNNGGGSSLITGPDGVCKLVTNNSSIGSSAYIPTASTAEWQSFYNHPPAGVSVSACQIVNTYTTPGAFTWTKPSANFSTVTIECWGGGGSGRTISYCGGGGGGGYSATTVSFASIPSTVTGVVGAGGAQNVGCASCNGIAGGASSFGAYVNAPGGAGGTSGNVSGGTGGGTGELWNGTVDKNAYGGGGGGGAGSGDGGPGGSSYLNGQPFIGGQGGGRGVKGQQPGGGGGSCVGYSSTETQWGGAGGDGMCRITVN